MKQKFIRQRTEMMLSFERVINVAAQYLQYFRDSLNSSQFIPLYPDKLVKLVEEEIQWIETFSKQKNSLLLMAEVNGRIIGNIAVTGHSRSMLQHTAPIGMSVSKEWRNKGYWKINDGDYYKLVMK